MNLAACDLPWKLLVVRWTLEFSLPDFLAKAKNFYRHSLASKSSLCQILHS
jgi:hypothetical protein